MYCSKCGTQNDDNAVKCKNCGAVIQQTGLATDSSSQKVSSHLAPAILVTIFCCLPFGIPAIVYAAKVNGKLAAGDYQGAVKASQNAKIWCWIAFASVVLYIAIIGILAAIAIPQFAAYRMRSYNYTAEAELRNLALLQDTYYIDNGTYTDSIEDLMKNYDYSPVDGVIIEVISAGDEDYHMISYHEQGNKTYQIIGPYGEVEEYYE